MLLGCDDHLKGAENFVKANIFIYWTMPLKIYDEIKFKRFDLKVCAGVRGCVYV